MKPWRQIDFQLGRPIHVTHFFRNLYGDSPQLVNQANKTMYIENDVVVDRKLDQFAYSCHCQVRSTNRSGSIDFLRAETRHGYLSVTWNRKHTQRISIWIQT